MKEDRRTMAMWLRVAMLVGLLLGLVAPLAALSPVQVISPRPQGWASWSRMFREKEFPRRC